MLSFNKKFLLLLCSFSIFSFAKGVLAGTKIVNIVYLEYKIENTQYHTTSNTLIDVVDRVLDIKLSCMQSESVVVDSGSKDSVLKFSLTNMGNAEDSYSLNTIFDNKSSDFQATNTRVYLDNGNGFFDAKDTQPSKIVVKEDESKLLFLVSDIPSSAYGLSLNAIEVNSIVRASHSYGDSFKLEDYFVVVATQEDANRAFCSYEVSPLSIVLNKSASFSTKKLYKGTTIHYKIEVHMVGIGDIENIKVIDNIPENTQYVENSITLNGLSVDGYKEGVIEVIIDKMTQTASSKPIYLVEFDVIVR
jgi:uncharacterized repeat protein (TIGR01451 family)